MMIGGTPTAIATMIPMRVPRSRLFHPVAVELALVSPVLPVELLVEVTPVVAEPPVVVDVGSLATGPTRIVVVDVGRLGVVASASGSQVSISAAMAPLSVAQQ